MTNEATTMKVPSEAKPSYVNLSTADSDAESRYKIEEVRSQKQIEEFIELAFELNKGSAYWVPPIRMVQREFFDRDKHPFYRHAEGIFFLLRDSSGKTVGRIAAFLDSDHEKIHGERIAFFGFYESNGENLVNSELFKAAEDWAKERGATALRGPYNFNSNYDCGLLVDAFDSSPVIGMLYNSPSKLEELLQLGFQKVMDLYAYYFYDFRHELPRRFLQHVERIKSENRVQIRPINPKKFDDEVELALEIYNDAWEKNWSFLPMSREEFIFRSKDMKAILDPEIAYFVYVDGKPAAFSLAVPDVHVAQKSLKTGRLFSWRILPFLWKLKGPSRRKHISRIRIITLGVKKEFQHLGLGALLYAEYFSRGKAAGYRSAECSWILENNRLMNRSLQMMKADHQKTYRILEKALV